MKAIFPIFLGKSVNIRRFFIPHFFLVVCTLFIMFVEQYFMKKYTRPTHTQCSMLTVCIRTVFFAPFKPSFICSILLHSIYMNRRPFHGKWLVTQSSFDSYTPQIRVVFILVIVIIAVTFAFALLLCSDCAPRFVAFGRAEFWWLFTNPWNKSQAMMLMS